MAGYKETPRQKMIGMLYLVLTALLALNVSKDILDAFLVVNEGMVSTNERFANKVSNVYARFESQFNLNPGKVGEYWNKAQEVRTKSQDLIEYLEDVQMEVVIKSEKKTKDEVLALYYTKTQMPDNRNAGAMQEKYMLDLSKVPSRDKYDEATNYMIGPNKNGEAYTMAQKIENYRQFILGIVGDHNADKIGLNTNEKFKDASGASQDWMYYNFYHTILAANVTILNKIISEVQSAEFDAVNRLYENISEKDYKFDRLSAEVIPNSTYILKGQNYEATVLLTAYDSKTQSEVKIVRGASAINDGNIGGAQVFRSENGVVKLTFPGQAEGPQRYAGVIEVRDPLTQEIKRHPFEAQYIVAPPSLTVAPLKMNILYSGLKNPISISAPGIPNEQIVPSITKGKIVKGANGTWDVEAPTGERTTTISAVASVEGKNLPLGSFEFRIKRVPDPIAKIADITDGTIEKNRLLASRAIIPEMVDFDFEGFHFEIVSYELSTYRGTELQRSGSIKGNQFTDAVTNMIKNAGRGQRLYFERIQAKGPDGTMRTLNPINLEIN